MLFDAAAHFGGQFDPRHAPADNHIGVVSGCIGRFGDVPQVTVERDRGRLRVQVVRAQ